MSYDDKWPVNCAALPAQDFLAAIIYAVMISGLREVYNNRLSLCEDEPWEASSVITSPEKELYSGLNRYYSSRGKLYGRKVNIKYKPGQYCQHE